VEVSAGNHVALAIGDFWTFDLLCAHGWWCSTSGHVGLLSCMADTLFQRFMQTTKVLSDSMRSNHHGF